MMRIGRLGQLSCACAVLVPISMAMAAAKPSTALLRLILPSHFVAPFERRLSCLSVGNQRLDAAGEPKDARPAFALDLFSGKSKRGDAAIDGETLARRRAVQRRGDAKNLAPPFSQ